MKSSTYLRAAVFAGCLSVLLSGCKTESHLDHVPPEQHAIAQEIFDMKGLYERAPEKGGIFYVNVQTLKKADDAFFGRLADAIPNLESLVADDSGMTDASLPHLKRFKNLQTLSIGSTKFTKKTDTQEGDDGRPVVVQIDVAVPLLSPKSIEALKKQFPDINIGGIDEAQTEQ